MFPKMRDLGQLKGPVDHEVPGAGPCARWGRGTLRGQSSLGYACHGDPRRSHYLWCGDYPGFAQLALEKVYPRRRPRSSPGGRGRSGTRCR